MKMTCALCGRPTEPAVMIGNEAIGPKCARKSGLMGVKIRAAGRVRILGRRTVKEEGPQTMDLFEEAA
jgi:hypothetical protein